MHVAKAPKLAQSAFQMGRETYRVPMSLHAANRAKVAALIVAATSKDAARSVARDVVLLKGGEQPERYDTDNEPLFRQESSFHYLFGVSEAGCLGALELPNGRSTLFVPRLAGNAQYEIFCGKFPTPDEFRSKYEVDEVKYVDELDGWLDDRLGADGSARVHVLDGVNSDSGARPVLVPTLGGAAAARAERGVLYNVLAEARVRKSEAEIELMRYTYHIASAAHVAALRAVRAGRMEYEVEAAFLHEGYARGGCRLPAYTCICASGPNAAVLHYGHAGAPNARELRGGELLLLDMGVEYHCYASDITNTVPVSGVYTAEQAAVYDAVLAAQRAVVGAIRPGVPWTEMHRLAERTILEGLRAAGLLSGDVADMIDADVGALFMPHGLGHLIGVDTHDVGGYLPGCPPRSDRPGLSRLRTARVLEPGMVITVEPGCYFIDALLDGALADPARARFLVRERVEAFRGFGGVRIEDGVVVTEGGAESLAACPRTRAEVEAVLAGGEWPPAKDDLPELRRSWCRLGAHGQGLQPIAMPGAAAA